MIKKRRTIIETPARRNLVKRRIAEKRNDPKLVLTERGKTRLPKRMDLRKTESAANRTWGNYPRIFLIIRQQLGKVKGKRIMEIGFGKSSLIKRLQKQGAITTGIEIKKPAETARIPNQVVGTTMNLPYRNNSFDCIISARVIEFGGITEAVFPPMNEETKKKIAGKAEIEKEQKDKERLILEIHRVLKPKGIIVMQTAEPWISKQEWEKNCFMVSQATSRHYTNAYFEKDLIKNKISKAPSRIYTFTIARKIK